MIAGNPSTRSATDIQRRYYADTAQRYDDMHGDDNQEHSFALQIMISVAKYLGIKSILDVGSGTGRALFKIKSATHDITVVGVEPSAELRKVGISKGLSGSELVDGDAMNLAFGDGSFDLVCEFGALHHIPMPSKAVSEMLRVSRKAIFISDCNNFGQGGGLSRFLKQAFNAAGLWPLVDKFKTKGKGYTISEGDGLAYSYSVFNDYKQIEEACASVHLLNTLAAGPNLYRTASHVALLGVKQPMKTLIETAVSCGTPSFAPPVFTPK
jgi:ubiquinone/menaquinone biosynthesis C-methylase UbiE